MQQSKINSQSLGSFLLSVFDILTRHDPQPVTGADENGPECRNFRKHYYYFTCPRKISGSGVRREEALGQYVNKLRRLMSRTFAVLSQARPLPTVPPTTCMSRGSRAALPQPRRDYVPHHRRRAGHPKHFFRSSSPPSTTPTRSPSFAEPAGALRTGLVSKRRLRLTESFTESCS